MFQTRTPAMLALAGMAGPLGAMVWKLLGAGAVASPSPVSLEVLIVMLLVAPVLEELAFRGAVTDGVQGLLKRFAVADTSFLSGTNVMTSMAFAACHLPYQSVEMAAAVLLPSLVLGKVREVTGSVLPCMALHAWFNACHALFVWA